MPTSPHENLSLIRRVLGSDYLELSIEHMTLDEDFDKGISRVKVETVDTHGKRWVVEGEGCGLVDATWTGLSNRYAREYESLRSIELAGFKVDGKLETKRRDNRGSDAVAEVTLDIRNSEGELFSFSDASRSVAASSAKATVAAIEYFMNAERAFITLHASLLDARERNRPDLVTRYTSELAEVVKSTSYAEVIEKLKKDL